MITQTEYQNQQRVHLEVFKVNEIERRTLREMAHTLGVPKSAIIRDGLQKVYSEFQALQAADHDNA